MNKVVAGSIVLGMFLTIAPMGFSQNHQPGGAKGFITGCCFGLRAGADYNDEGTGDREFVPWFLVGCCLGARTQIDYQAGKDWHWREAGRIIPYVGVVFAIWDGLDTMDGKGRSDYQKAYGSNFY